MLNSKNSLMKFLSALMAATLVFTFLPLNALSVLAEGEGQDPDQNVNQELEEDQTNPDPEPEPNPEPDPDPEPEPDPVSDPPLQDDIEDAPTSNYGIDGDGYFTVVVSAQKGTESTEEIKGSFVGSDGNEHQNNIYAYKNRIKGARVHLYTVKAYQGKTYNITKTTDDNGIVKFNLESFYEPLEWPKDIDFKLEIEVPGTGYKFNAETFDPNQEWDYAYFYKSAILQKTNLKDDLIKIAGIKNNGSYVFDYELDDNHLPVVRKASDCFTLSAADGLTATYTDGKEPEFTDASDAPYSFSVSFSGEGYTDGDDNDEDDIYVQDFTLKINRINRSSFKFDETYVKKTFYTDGTKTTHLEVTSCDTWEEPDLEIKYESDDPDTAEVKPLLGIVTFKKPGKVKITATMAASTNYNKSTAYYEIEAKKDIVFKFDEDPVKKDYTTNITYTQTIDIDTSLYDKANISYSIDSDTTKNHQARIDQNGKVYNIKSAGKIVVKATFTANDCYTKEAFYTLEVGLAKHTLALSPDQEFVFGKQYLIFNEPSTEPVIDDESDKEWYKIVKKSDGKYYLEVTAGSVNYTIKKITADADDSYGAFSAEFTENNSGKTAKAKQTVEFEYTSPLYMDTGAKVYLLDLKGNYVCDDADVQINATWSDNKYSITNKEAKYYDGTRFPNKYYVFITFNDHNLNPGTCVLTVTFPGNDNYETKTIENYEFVLRYSDEVDTRYTLVNSKDSTNIEGANGFYREDVTVKPLYADGILDYSNTIVPSYTLSESKIYEKRKNVVFIKDDKSSVNTIEEIKIDKDKPVFSIDITGQIRDEDNFMRLLDGGVLAVYSASKATVTVTANDKLSGIDKIKYDIGDGEIVLDNLAGDTFEIGTKTFFMPNQNVVGSFDIPADKRANLKIWIYDVAGNYIATVGEGTSAPYINSDLINFNEKQITNNENQQIDIITDTIKPVVTVNFDDLEPENSNFFKTDRAATISIDEENYFLEDLTINITKNGTLLSTDSDDYKKIVKVDEKENKKIYLEFMDDGHYELDIYCTDPAQNVGEAEYTGKACTDFYIDKTYPEVNVSFNNDDSDVKHNGKYFSTSRIATVEVNESNYDYSGLDIKVYLNNSTDAAVAGTDYVVTQDESNDHKAYIEFTNDANYRLDVTFTDLAGNTVKADPKEDFSKEFTIDKTKPAVKVDYTSEASVQNEMYFSETRTATITVTELNFDESKILFTVNGVKKDLKWNPTSSDTHVATYDFSEEGRYNVDFSCVDKADNENSTVDYGTIAPTEFVIDPYAPSNPAITIDGVSVAGDSNITFETFYNHAVTIKFSADYGVSGPDLVQYQIVDVNDVVDYNGPWTDYNEATGIKVSTGNSFVVYFYTTDKAGNELIVNSKGIVIDDKQPEGETKAPEIDIIPSAPNSNGYYNSDVSVKLNVVEPAYAGETKSASGSYSGLKEITYRIISKALKKEVTGTLFSLEDGTGLGKAGLNKKTNLYNSWSDTIKIDSALFNSNDVIVEVKAIDNAGNPRISSTTEGDIKIDVTKPSIRVTYNNNTADTDNCFKDERVATVVITERNFNPGDVKITLTSSAGTMPEVNGWAKSEASGNGDGTTWTTTIPFSKDADYTFDISYTDLAGNAADNIDFGNSVSPKAFTVDKTVPVITVRYDNNNATNDIYYKEVRTATVSIVERNFDPARVNIVLKATDDGKTIASPKIGNWSHNGDTHTITISYDTDGKYVFDISVKDKAGNDSAEFAEQTFYIDTKVPELKISGVKDKSANNGDLAPEFTYSDTNYSPNLVYITYSSANKGKIELDGTYTDIHNGKSFKFNNYAKNKDSDDIYTLEITIVDMAGNESTQKVTYSVNRFGSTYEVAPEVEKLRGHYVTEPIDIVVTEVNPNALVENVVTVYKNGESITLVKGIDYDVQEVGGDGSWHQYKYVIHKDVFKDDGVYSISIYSRDEAGNVSENTLETKDTGLQFGIDATRPNIVATNLSSNKTYAVESYTVKLLVTDNLLLDRVDVYLDDYSTPYRSFVNGDDFTFDITDSSTSAHKLKVVGTDAAGNVQELEITNFYVTTNLFVRFYTNTPLFVGSIIGFLLILALIVFIVVFKRRKTARR